MNILPKNQKDLVEVIHDEIKISHLVIAEHTKNKPESIRDIIGKYKTDFSEFGATDFKSVGTNGTKNFQKVYYLNRDQSLLLMTYLRNNQIVRKFKIELVKAFSEMENIIYKQNQNFITALKKEIDFIELNSSEEEFKDDENYLLKRYLYALEQNGTHVQRFVIKLIEENHKQKLDLELKTKDLISQNFLVNKAQEYTTPVSKLFQRFYQYIKENESSFKIIPKYDNFRASIDTRAVFPFGIIDRKENTLVITVKELNIFCDRNNFSNREFLNAFSERGLLIKDNESMNLNCTYVNCYMFKDIYL